MYSTVHHMRLESSILYLHGNIFGPNMGFLGPTISHELYMCRVVKLLNLEDIVSSLMSLYLKFELNLSP